MRTLNEIAKEISNDWKKMSVHAMPYVRAMRELKSLNDQYFMDTARDIVLRFLCNAGTWRGETARRIKKELKEMLDNR